MSDYGTIAGVEAYVPHQCNAAGHFDATTAPTLAQVTVLLDEVSAQLTGWLAAAGYQTPVVQTAALAVLSRYANNGAAGLCELTQRTAGASDDKNQRENKFLKEFEKAEQWIMSGALAALGVPQVRLQSALFGLSAGGVNFQGQNLRPSFTRTDFGNQPGAGTSRGEEP